MQIDGEPWMQPPCIIQIIHKNQVPMLIGMLHETSPWIIVTNPTFRESKTEYLESFTTTNNR